MKSILFVFVFFFSLHLNASTKLLLIGGGTRPESAMAKFASLAGSTKANILIIGWASTQANPASTIQSELSKYNPKKIEVAPLAPMNAQDKMHFLSQLKTATGIFFTGGDQNRIMSELEDLTLRGKLIQMYQDGIIFAGTSAGTAIMSKTMLTGNGDLTVINGSAIETTNGLGLLAENIIIDQHFIVRQRFNRLAGLILNSKTNLGIGIDEGTALLVTDNANAEVIGPTQVIFFDGINEKSMKLTILSDGEEFNLKTRQ